MENCLYPDYSRALNIFTPPAFQVGFRSSVVADDDDIARIMECDVILSSVDPAEFLPDGTASIYIREFIYHSLPDLVPAYIDGGAIIKQLYQDTPTPRGPVLTFALGHKYCDPDPDYDPDFDPITVRYHDPIGY